MKNVKARFRTYFQAHYVALQIIRSRALTVGMVEMEGEERFEGGRSMFLHPFGI